MKQITPLVSIIVPVYNAEKFIHKCIDSIRTQTYENFELILVDDGSTDNSGIICDEYAQKESRIITIHKPNNGVSSARNKGLDTATGEFITFIDSDDCINPQFLEKLLYNIADLTICSVITNLNREYSLINHIYDLPSESHIISTLVNNIFLKTPWGKLFKREIIIKNNLRFDENIRYGEDTLFVLNYIKDIKNIACISNPLYYYTEIEYHSEAITKYNLELREIDYTIRSINTLVAEIERKYSCSIQRQYALDILNSYPLIRILEQGDTQYFSIYKDCTNNDIISFYNDTTVSPILRGIIEIKELYYRKIYKQAYFETKLIRKQYASKFKLVQKQKYNLKVLLNILNINPLLFHIIMISCTKLLKK